MKNKRALIVAERYPKLNIPQGYLMHENLNHLLKKNVKEILSKVPGTIDAEKLKKYLECNLINYPQEFVTNKKAWIAVQRRKSPSSSSFFQFFQSWIICTKEILSSHVDFMPDRGT